MRPPAQLFFHELSGVVLSVRPPLFDPLLMYRFCVLTRVFSLGTTRSKPATTAAVGRACRLRRAKPSVTANPPTQVVRLVQV